MSIVGQVLSWLRKGTWTILDQALFAGSNFVLNVLLVAALTEEGYGAYAIAFAVFLFFGTIHTGILTEPMLVFGSGRFRTRFGKYLAFLQKAHFVFALFSGIALALLSVVVTWLGSPLVGEALLVLAIAQPFILFLWLMRRSCYVLLSPKTSALGGLIYMIVVLTGAYLMNRAEILTVTSALLLMAGSSLVGALWILFRLETTDGEQELQSAEVITEHRKYSGWATATGVLGWLPGQLPFLILPLVVGTAGPGILKALLNFIMPAAHAYAALSILLVPMFVRARATGVFRKFVFATAALLVVGNGLYWVLLGIFGESLIQLLYDGKYIEYAGYLWLAGAYPFVSGLAVVVRTALRSLELPNYVFWASVGSSIGAGTIGLFLIYNYGVQGAIIAITVTMAIELVIMVFYFNRASRSRRVSPGGAAFANAAGQPATGPNSGPQASEQQTVVKTH